MSNMYTSLVELTALVSDARAIKHKPIDKIRIIEIGLTWLLLFWLILTDSIRVFCYVNLKL